MADEGSLEPQTAPDEVAIVGGGTLVWQEDPQGPEATALLDGKSELPVDAVTPVPGEPGAYYIFTGDHYLRVTLVISFVTTPPQTAGDTPNDRRPRVFAEGGEQIVFVQPPSYH